MASIGSSVQEALKWVRKIILPGADVLLTNQNDSASYSVMPGSPANRRRYAMRFSWIWRSFPVPDTSNGDDMRSNPFDHSSPFLTASTPPHRETPPRMEDHSHLMQRHLFDPGWSCCRSHS